MMDDQTLLANIIATKRTTYRYILLLNVSEADSGYYNTEMVNPSRYGTKIHIAWKLIDHEKSYILLGTNSMYCYNVISECIKPNLPGDAKYILLKCCE